MMVAVSFSLMLFLISFSSDWYSSDPLRNMSFQCGAGLYLIKGIDILPNWVFRIQDLLTWSNSSLLDTKQYSISAWPNI